jgi:hypothetical protein
MALPDPSEIAFVGDDPNSDKAECPAVWRGPGGVFVRGKTVDDPAVTSRLGVDIGKGADETDVWVPETVFPAIREAIDGTYEEGRQGPGPHDFATLAAACERSVIRFETRDAYDVSEAGTFAEWRQTGAVAHHDLGEFGEVVRAAVGRGVVWRRVRIISRPMSEYMRWEHAITSANLAVGEDIRWLWRDEAADLLVPAADCWVFDDRVIRWNFQRGDDSNPHVYAFGSDPRIVRDLAGAFELAWNRATPHERFKPE